MPSFAYQARDGSGERVSGTRDAPDKRAALEALRAMGLFVTQLGPDPGSKGTAGSSHGRERAAQYIPAPAPVPTPITPPTAEGAPAIAQQAGISEAAASLPAVPAGAGQLLGSLPARQAPPLVPLNYWLAAGPKERSLFFRQMHAMLNAGTSVGQALKTLSQHGANRSLRHAAAEMGEAASTGRPWGETMRAYPALFDPLDIGMIVAGENGGFLDRSCLRLAEYAERDYDLQQTIKRETWYPKLLVVCSILIPSAVPFVMAMVNGGNPLLAWFHQIWLPLTVLAVVCLAWKAWNRFMPAATHSGPVRIAFDWIKLQVPIVSKISRGLAAAKFCRALGALYASGMGVNRMVEVAAGTSGNASFSAAVRRAEPELERGRGLTDAMRDTRQFPGIALQMMHTGEISGNIDTQLDKVADFLEQDAETALKQAVKVLGIVIYLVVAIYIGSQVIGQYTSVISGEMDAGQQMIDNP